MQGEQRAPLVLVAPVDGAVVALREVSDPVFAQQVAGPGVAVVPQGRAGSRHESVDRRVLAPVTGRIVSLLPHAFAVESVDGRTVLVHLGLDVEHAHRGTFAAQVQPGEHVDAGAHVITWTPDAAAREPACPVVALRADPDDVELLLAPGSRVSAGEPVVRWR